jgi:choline dehydrogenase-like flavoprotein
VIEASGHVGKTLRFNLLSSTRRFFLSHLVIVMTNLHSKDGPYYEMQINPTKSATGKLCVSRDYIKHEKRIDRHLRLKFLKIGFLALPFGKKGVTNGPGYHVGGSLPMGGIGDLATDYLGRLEGSVKVHFVDTSVLPNIPATTIGFLAMANAHRIAKTTLSL